MVCWAHKNSGAEPQNSQLSTYGRKREKKGQIGTGNGTRIRENRVGTQNGNKQLSEAFTGIVNVHLQYGANSLLGSRARSKGTGKQNGRNSMAWSSHGVNIESERRETRVHQAQNGGNLVGTKNKGNEVSNFTFETYKLEIHRSCSKIRVG